MIDHITYVPTWEGWLYLATVIDVHTRMVIGYATGDNYRTPLISAALQNATTNQHIQLGAVFPSDRGSNYTTGPREPPMVEDPAKVRRAGLPLPV